MKSYDVLGYADTEKCLIYCLDCADGKEGKLDPIFADSEWDYYPSCDFCGDAILDVQLTAYGKQQYGIKKSIIEDEREESK